MRIRDWSSDGCSSELAQFEPHPGHPQHDRPHPSDGGAAGGGVRLSRAATSASGVAGGTTSHAPGVLPLTTVTAPFGHTPRHPTSTTPAAALRPFLRPRYLRSALASEVVPSGPKPPPARLPHLRQTSTVRSEEHTSELQSLMRISYAVFCLKK